MLLIIFMNLLPPTTESGDMLAKLFLQTTTRQLHILRLVSGTALAREGGRKVNTRRLSMINICSSISMVDQEEDDVEEQQTI